MNKKLIAVLFVITAAICAGIMYSKYDGSEALSKAYGNVDIRQSSLAFERSGRIVKLNFDEGQKVKKDEILAVLDTEALNYQIQINEANMRQAKASLDEMVRGYRTEDIKQAGANVKRLEDKADRKKDKVLKYEFWGLMFFVAIPLPGTGAWTGALIAAMLDMQLKRAFPAIAAGVVIAAVIVTVATYGVAALI